MTTETTTTSGLPPLVPFTEQHGPVRDPFYVRPTSNWVQDCQCGTAVRVSVRARESEPPIASAVLAAFERHYRGVARLTPEQCRVLRSAEEFHPQGRLPMLTTLTTRKPLEARGLIEPAPLQPGENAEPYRITGRGRGVLAEHRRRSA